MLQRVENEVRAALGIPQRGTEAEAPDAAAATAEESAPASSRKAAK